MKLQKNTLILIKTINRSISDDTYKVVEKEEFLKQFKKRQKVDELVLSGMMNFLQKHGYIDIKYSDAQVYCLAVKPKARNYSNDSDEKLTKQLNNLKKWFVLGMLLSGLSAFLGTAAAIYLFLR